MRFQMIHPNVIHLYFSALEMSELHISAAKSGWTNALVNKTNKKSKEFNAHEAGLLKVYKTPDRIQDDINILCGRIGEA